MYRIPQLSILYTVENGRATVGLTMSHDLLDSLLKSTQVHSVTAIPPDRLRELCVQFAPAQTDTAHHPRCE